LTNMDTSLAEMVTAFKLEGLTRKHEAARLAHKLFRAMETLRNYLAAQGDAHTAEQRQAAKILGVRWPCGLEQLAAGYRQWAKNCHPDQGGTDEAFKRVQRAYEYLKTIIEAGTEQPEESAA